MFLSTWRPAEDHLTWRPPHLKGGYQICIRGILRKISILLLGSSFLKKFKRFNCLRYLMLKYWLKDQWTRSLVHQVSGLPFLWSTRSLVHQVFGPSGFWSIRFLVHQVSGPPGLWSRVCDVTEPWKLVFCFSEVFELKNLLNVHVSLNVHVLVFCLWFPNFINLFSHTWP